MPGPTEPAAPPAPAVATGPAPAVPLPAAGAAVFGARIPPVGPTPVTGFVACERLPPAADCPAAELAEPAGADGTPPEAAPAAPDSAALSAAQPASTHKPNAAPRRTIAEIDMLNAVMWRKNTTTGQALTLNRASAPRSSTAPRAPVPLRRAAVRAARALRAALERRAKTRKPRAPARARRRG